MQKRTTVRFSAYWRQRLGVEPLPVIRAARLAPLLTLLQKRGLQIIPRAKDNFELAAYPGLIVQRQLLAMAQCNLARNGHANFLLA
jgi:hypothetical protein